MRSFSKLMFPLVVACLTLVPCRETSAEILPTKGTFRGIYHENRAGVGHFLFFIVHKDLRQQMTEFEGKYIELQVLAGRQPINPGPAIIDKIGNVKLLPAPPLAAEIKTVVPGVGGPGTFDIVYSFKNVSKHPVEFSINDVMIGFEQFQKADEPDKVDRFFGSGYTWSQFNYKRDATQRFNFISPTEPGRSTPFYGREIALRPSESVPFVWHGLRNRADKLLGDVEVSAPVYDGPKKDSIPIAAWKRLDLPLPKSAEGDDGLQIDAKVTRQAEWLTVDARLRNTTRKPRHIFAHCDDDDLMLPGLVEFLGPDEKSLALDLEWRGPPGAWIRRSIDDMGIPFRFRIRHSRRFSTVQEATITFTTLTESGMQRLTVAKDLPPRAVRPLPEWGMVDQGYRCRIQAAKDQWNSDEPIRVFVQAESNRKEPNVLVIRAHNSAKNITIEVDGRPAELASSGLGGGFPNDFPFETEFTLAQTKLAVGRHVLKITIKGDVGVYEHKNTNTNKITQRQQFDGTLVSNEVVFEIK